MQDSNRAAGTGGYQAGYSDDFMEGPDPGASNQAGDMEYGDPHNV